MAKEIRFVARIENKGNSMQIDRLVTYPENTTDEEIDRDYNDWIDSVNKGYWEEV